MADLYSLTYAEKADREDPLAGFSERFVISEKDLIYLDGNSLGRLGLESENNLKAVIREQWGDRLVRSWNEGWYQQSVRLGRKIAQLIGAHPEEVLVCDSTSINLYKLVYASLILDPGRTEIISDDMNFPTDLYIIQGVVKQLGDKHMLRLLKSPDGISANLTELLRILGSRTALLTLSHVVFKSAYLYDMEKVTALAHMHGARVIWDLSHSVGVVPINLKKANADMAVGCTYKYLNGGPGSPAFIYVRKDLQEKLSNPIQGWFGEQNPFEFRLNYRKADGIRQFLTGTPPVLSVSALEPALDMILEAGIAAIRQKSIRMTTYLMKLADHWLKEYGFRIGTPEQEEKRGSHISLKHVEAYRVCKALADPAVGSQVVIPDFREPNNIRLGVAPLYTRYTELYQALDQIRVIMAGKLYERYPSTRDSVT